MAPLASQHAPQTGKGTKRLTPVVIVPRHPKTASSGAENNHPGAITEENLQHLPTPAASHSTTVAIPQEAQAPTVSKYHDHGDRHESRDYTDDSSEVSDDRGGLTLDSELLHLIESLPPRLAFFLEPNVDLNKKAHTKALILEGIRHFIPSYEPPIRNPKKGLFLRVFSLQILPLIKPYLEWKAEQREADELCQASQMEEDPIQLDLSGINPQSPNITTDVILTIIATLRPKLRIPEVLPKSAAVSLFYQHICPRPSGGHPTPYTTWAVPVPKPFHRYLTKDDLRYGVQCHAPIVYIPITASKPILLAIYEQYVLDDISDDMIHEGIHYFIRQEP